MKPEAQRIAIAEACGWTPSKVDHCWNNPSRMETRDELPDYLDDLDDMHEAEKTIRPGLQSSYISRLADVLIESGLRSVGAFDYATATAAQRAEAFLRTMGKWEGGE